MGTIELAVNKLALLIYVVTALHLAYLAVLAARVARAGPVLLELSRPNRKWWWLAGPMLLIAILGFLFGGVSAQPNAAVSFTLAAFFGLQGAWGVQARERGLLIYLELVPWKRVDVRSTEPNDVLVIVRHGLHWDTTHSFTVLADKRPDMEALLQRLPRDSEH